MLNILVIYHYNGEYPVRTATIDHLYCFQKYAQHNCYYLNVAVKGLPQRLKKVRFDIIIFHTLFFSARWSRPLFERVVEKISSLKDSDAVKVAMPQDEFLNTDILVAFIKDFGVDCLFSVTPETEWEKMYPSVSRQKVKFVRILTGYLDDNTIARIDRLTSPGKNRLIDIGYRAWRAPAWLGRHGILKVQIADLFQERAPSKGLKTDISTRPEDTYLGDAWYDFLLRCKYIIGVEGGASILDRDGSIRAKTDTYTREHPRASFEEVEANCFPGMDGGLSLFAISPRHLEACATRTCQVLIEGSYNGVLRAEEHYIPLARDFSNIEQVLDLIRQDGLREEMVERAHRDVVASRRYTYQSFVEKVIAESLGTAPAHAASTQSHFRDRLALSWVRITDKLTWLIVMLHWYTVVLLKRQIRNKLVSAFSEQTVSSLVRRVTGKPEV